MIVSFKKSKIYIKFLKKSPILVVDIILRDKNV